MKKKRNLKKDFNTGYVSQTPFPANAPSIKDAKPRKSTPVKNYPGLGIAPTIKKA
jgi:hypothetical protein